MSTGVAIQSACLLLLAVTAGAARDNNTVAPPDVTVCAVGFGPVDPLAKATAQTTATRLFQTIGVSVAWTGGGDSIGTGVALRLRIETEPVPDRFSKAALAYAHPYAGGTREIVVFWNRVERCPPKLVGKLLGHVMAHEIAHVVQGIEWHSETGLMKANWSAEDYYVMLWSDLPFTAAGADRIREGLDRLRKTHGRQPIISSASTASSAPRRRAECPQSVAAPR